MRHYILHCCPFICLQVCIRGKFAPVELLTEFFKVLSQVETPRHRLVGQEDQFERFVENHCP